MNQPQFDPLDKIFREVQADLPPQLEAKLRAVPHRVPAIPFWEPEWMLPAAGLFLGSLWWALSHAGTIYQQVVAFFKGLTLPEFKVTVPLLEWTLPTIPQIEPLFFVSGGAAVALAMGLGSLLFLQAEARADGDYIHNLNRHI